MAETVVAACRPRIPTVPSAANQAKLYLLSGLANELAEELFTIPLQNAQQTRNLLTADATCLILPDAHKTLDVVE